MDIELRRLRHLMALAEFGTFGRAAPAVFLTQPALSRSIQALERDVGARLVDRRPTGVELTDMGHLVLRHAVALDASARDLDREVRLTKDLELGELRIGVGPWAASSLVAPVIGRMNRLFPRLRIAIVVTPWRELPQRVRAREVDLMVGGSSDVAELDDFDYVTLSTHDTVVVGRVGHPLTNARHVERGDLFAYPIVGPGLDSGAADLLADLAGSVGHAASTTAVNVLTVECDSSEVLKGIVASSDALTIMPRFLVDADVAARRLAIVTDIGLRVEFGAAWLHGRTLGRAGTTLLELLQT